MKKKKMKLFDKFYVIWCIIIFVALIGCILWYFLVERPNNEEVDVAYERDNVINIVLGSSYEKEES